MIGLDTITSYDIFILPNLDFKNFRSIWYVKLSPKIKFKLCCPILNYKLLHNKIQIESFWNSLVFTRTSNKVSCALVIIKTNFVFYTWIRFCVCINLFTMISGAIWCLAHILRIHAHTPTSMIKGRLVLILYFSGRTSHNWRRGLTIYFWNGHMKPCSDHHCMQTNLDLWSVGDWTQLWADGHNKGGLNNKKNCCE